MPSIDELKTLGIIALFSAMFLAGYHVRGVIEAAHQEKQERADIAATTKQLLADNQIDQNYEKQINIIDTAADNSNQVINHETDSHNCSINVKWMRYINSSN